MGKETSYLYCPYKAYVIILTLKDDVSASASAFPSAGQRKSWLYSLNLPRFYRRLNRTVSEDVFGFLWHVYIV